MRLARLCGLNVAGVSLTNTSGKDVLLVERFDRIHKSGQDYRKLMLSALTLLNLDEMTARYASYEDLAEIIRSRFIKPRETLHELFGRLVFNILCGNTDDHARNHSAFWDGKDLTLTPAYDICPQMRQGGEASQAMAILGNNRSSRLDVCLKSSMNFMLNEDGARQIIRTQIETIKNNWEAICSDAQLSPIDEKLFKDRLFLNSYAFQGYYL